MFLCAFVVLALFGMTFGHALPPPQRNVTIAERPWHASINLRWSEQANATMTHLLMSGAIIGPRLVVTTGRVMAYTPSGTIVVRVGSDNATNGGHLENVIRVILHPEYRRESLVHDIALLVLNAPLDFNANVRAISLPNAKPLPEGTKVSFSGWGYDREGEMFRRAGLEVSDRVIWNHDACVHAGQNQVEVVTDGNICTAPQVEDGVPSPVRKMHSII